MRAGVITISGLNGPFQADQLPDRSPGAQPTNHLQSAQTARQGENQRWVAVVLVDIRRDTGRDFGSLYLPDQVLLQTTPASLQLAQPNSVALDKFKRSLGEKIIVGQ